MHLFKRMEKKHSENFMQQIYSRNVQSTFYVKIAKLTVE